MSTKNDQKDEGTKAEEQLVDAGSEYSFPASDPPSFMGGSAVAGPPPHEALPPREPPSCAVSNPEEVKPVPAQTDQASAQPEPAGKKP